MRDVRVDVIGQDKALERLVSGEYRAIIVQGNSEPTVEALDKIDFHPHVTLRILVTGVE